MITNWARVNSTLKWLIKAYDNPYFDLLAFCNSKDLNYNQILGFIAIGRLILSGELNITNDIKLALQNVEKISYQLELSSV